MAAERCLDFRRRFAKLYQPERERKKTIVRFNVDKRISDTYVVSNLVKLKKKQDFEFQDFCDSDNLRVPFKRKVNLVGRKWYF